MTHLRQMSVNLLSFGATLATGVLLCVGDAAAACRFNVTSPAVESDGGTNGVSIRLVVSRSINLGTFTRPDAPGSGGGATQENVVLSPDGTRSLPPTLVIRSDELNPARSPYAAIVDVTGGPNCGFEIVVGNTTARLNAVGMQGEAPYVFGTSTTQRARGRLDATGRFRFHVGVTQVVRSNNAAIGGTIELTANYRNAP